MTTRIPRPELSSQHMHAQQPRELVAGTCLRGWSYTRTESRQAPVPLEPATLSSCQGSGPAPGQVLTTGGHCSCRRQSQHLQTSHQSPWQAAAAAQCGWPLWVPRNGHDQARYRSRTTAHLAHPPAH